MLNFYDELAISKKELQSYCGMISSLNLWFPNVTFANKHLNVATTHGLKFVWTADMQREYEEIKLIFQDQIRVSHFNPNKSINIFTDGVSSKGIGFVFYQHPDKSNPSEDVTIV